MNSFMHYEYVLYIRICLQICLFQVHIMHLCSLTAKIVPLDENKSHILLVLDIPETHFEQIHTICSVIVSPTLFFPQVTASPP